MSQTQSQYSILKLVFILAIPSIGLYINILSLILNEVFYCCDQDIM